MGALQPGGAAALRRTPRLGARAAVVKHGAACTPVAGGPRADKSTTRDDPGREGRAKGSVQAKRYAIKRDAVRSDEEARHEREESQAGRRGEAKGSEQARRVRGKPSRRPRSEAPSQAFRSKQTRGVPADESKRRCEEATAALEPQRSAAAWRLRAASVPTQGQRSGRSPCVRSPRGIIVNRAGFRAGSGEARDATPGIGVVLSHLLRKVCGMLTAVTDPRRRGGRGALPRDTVRKEVACRAPRHAPMRPGRGTPSRLRLDRSPARA
jgi:hypothetical protein